MDDLGAGAWLTVRVRSRTAASDDPRIVRRAENANLIMVRTLDIMVQPVLEGTRVVACGRS